jgi:hypothetical protein
VEDYLMSRLLIFTAGTSLFENLRDPDKQFRRLDLVEGFRYGGAGAWHQVLRRAPSLRGELVSYACLFAPLNLADQAQRMRATAEMAAFYLLRQTQADVANRLVLLCSDTGAGAFCALANAMLLGQTVCYADQTGNPTLSLNGLAATEAAYGFHSALDKVRLAKIEVVVVKGLDPTRPANFEDKAIPSLVAAIARLHYNRAQQETTVLNYTGGFKAAVPTLTQAAALAGNIEMVCLYEDAASLIQQPLIPITLSAEARERLLWAGETDAAHPDLLRDCQTLDGLKRDEWAFYREEPGGKGISLSSFGKAMKELLCAQRRRQGL